MWKNSKDHLSRLVHFHPHPGGGEGWQRGWEENHKTGRKSVHGKNTTVYLPIVGLTDFEHFLPEIKDGTFC